MNHVQQFFDQSNIAIMLFWKESSQQKHSSWPPPFYFRASYLCLEIQQWCWFGNVCWEPLEKHRKPGHEQIFQCNWKKNDFTLCCLKRWSSPNVSWSLRIIGLQSTFSFITGIFELTVHRMFQMAADIGRVRFLRHRTSRRTPFCTRNSTYSKEIPHSWKCWAVL